MPRSPTILTPPPGILPFVPNTTIRSQDANALFNDLYQDGNTPRPIAYGGTGANNAQDALNNLGAIGQSNFLNAFSIGDGYYSTRNISSEGGVWLKRDGALYDSATYPELAAILPSLPDGVEWSPRSVSATNITTSLATSSGIFVGSTGSPNSTIIFSSDGEAWSTVASIPESNIRGIAQGSGIFVSVYGNGNVSNSPDGVLWSSPIVVASGQGFGGVAYGAGLFVAVGTNGIIYTSPDGSIWTSRTSGVSSILNRVKFVNSNFVITGGNGVILTSSDGIVWSPRTSGVTSALQSAAFGAGVYVVVGDGGVILSSTNLSSWTPRSSGTTAALSDVVCSTSGFMAVGASGVVRISSNGISWAASGTGVSTTFNTVTFDPDSEETYYAGGGATLLKGIRTLPTQFRVPNDSPQYGWIKAEND